MPAVPPVLPSAKYTDDETGVPNGRGRRTSMHNGPAAGAGHGVTWRYDARGRTTQAAHTVRNATGFVSPKVVGWAYDSGDRVTALTYPTIGTTTEVVSYAYDAAWRPTSACTSLGGCYVAGATYTALDQPTAHTVGNNLAQTWTYTNVMARLDGIKVGPDSTRFHRDYTYDAVGNVATIVDRRLSPTQTQTFGYDRRDRLTSAATSGNGTGAYSETYTYDAIGNLTSKAGTSYAYPAGGANSVRPHAPTTVGGQGYTYDDNGNLLTGGGRTHTWDTQGQAATIAKSGTTEGYTYDADGQRVTRVRGTVTTVYVNGLYEEERTSGKTRLHYPFNGKIIAQRERTSAGSAGTLLYLHGDHLGSVGLATSTTGGVTSRQEFKPWGELRVGGADMRRPAACQARRGGVALGTSRAAVRRPP
jgi:YD repeat-containing protein